MSRNTMNKPVFHVNQYGDVSQASYATFHVLCSHPCTICEQYFPKTIICVCSMASAPSNYSSFVRENYRTDRALKSLLGAEVKPSKREVNQVNDVTSSYLNSADLA